MIIVRLRGGLGNQLFQYAAGKSLAMHHNTELKFDTYTYKSHPYRKFQLHHFLIDDPVAEEKEINSLIGNNKVLRYINKRYNTLLNSKKVFIQPHYHFYQNFFNLPSPLYLSGYWQSEKYFLPVKKQIQEKVIPRLSFSEENRTLVSRMQSGNSVSLHIRRGDYTSNSRYADFFGVVEDAYYERAMDRIYAEVENPEFYVFSDDIEWSKKKYDSFSNFTFIDHNQGDNSYWDMVLMSNCKHNIIANSTFSWWGAWLNQNPGKKVVAPKKWFNQEYFSGPDPVYKDRHYNTGDLIPSGWLTL